jgi:HD superfamily phosphodiesterase
LSTAYNREGSESVSEEREAILLEIEAWVRETLETSPQRAHGWPHTDRVRRMIRILAGAEGVDPLLAELAALLHDVGRTEPGPEQEHGARSAAAAVQHLQTLSLADQEQQAVLHAIRWHNSTRADTALLRILRDADMLDGLGAMGILRAFMSKSHLPPYDPAAPFEEGRDRWPPSFSSDQLLGQMTWVNNLNTWRARQMAERRIALMNDFVAQARRELLQPDA